MCSGKVRIVYIIMYIRHVYSFDTINWIKNNFCLSYIYRVDKNLYKNNFHCDKLSNQTLLNFLILKNSLVSHV